MKPQTTPLIELEKLLADATPEMIENAQRALQAIRELPGNSPAAGRALDRVIDALADRT